MVAAVEGGQLESGHRLGPTDDLTGSRGVPVVRRPPVVLSCIGAVYLDRHACWSLDEGFVVAVDDDAVDAPCAGLGDDPVGGLVGRQHQGHRVVQVQLDLGITRRLMGGVRLVQADDAQRRVGQERFVVFRQALAVGRHHDGWLPWIPLAIIRVVVPGVVVRRRIIVIGRVIVVAGIVVAGVVVRCHVVIAVQHIDVFRLAAAQGEQRGDQQGDADCIDTAHGVSPPLSDQDITPSWYRLSRNSISRSAE